MKPGWNSNTKPPKPALKGAPKTSPSTTDETAHKEPAKPVTRGASKSIRGGAAPPRLSGGHSSPKANESNSTSAPAAQEAAPKTRGPSKSIRGGGVPPRLSGGYSAPNTDAANGAPKGRARGKSKKMETFDGVIEKMKLKESEALELFVPGRICIIGEHSDWASHYRKFNSNVGKGYCIVSGTNQGLYTRTWAHPNKLIMRCITNTGETHEEAIEMDAAALRAKAQEGSFFAYAAGVAYCMLVHYQIQGLVIDNYKTDLPVKKGLSSSAAICTSVARAFNRIYDCKLTVRGEMEMAYLGEIQTPSRCGRMDQCCAFGQNMVLMTFDGDHLDVEVMPMKGVLHLVIVDLKAAKDTQEILATLNRAYPFPTNEIEEGVHKMLGPINETIIDATCEALYEGDQEEVGRLMVEYQENFDKYLEPQCPSQLKSPVLHKLLSHPFILAHTYGAKGIGSQGDGSAQLLAKSPEDQEELVKFIEKELGMAAMTLTLGMTPRVTKAIIPVAGFHPELYPANITSAGLFPVLDNDGLCKPAILIIVEEALSAGIEEIVVVVSPDDLPSYEKLFHTPIPIDRLNRLSQAAQGYEARLRQMGKKIKLVVQDTSLGFGGAILTAADEIGENNFLLLLGDHLYRSTSVETCAQQLMKRFKGTPMVGLRWTPETEVVRVGTVNGRWDEGTSSVEIMSLVEKPTMEFARSNLMPIFKEETSPKGAAADPYLSLFGNYILPPKVFSILAQMQQNQDAKTPLDFTPALDRLRKDEGFRGVLMNGSRYDLGRPENYKTTSQLSE